MRSNNPPPPGEDKSEGTEGTNTPPTVGNITDQTKVVDESAKTIVTYVGPAIKLQDPTSGTTFLQGQPTQVKKETADRLSAAHPNDFAVRQS